MIQVGKCPLCGDDYVEEVRTPDGGKETLKGSMVLGHILPIISTTYRELFLVLSDLTITRLSVCSKHWNKAKKKEVEQAFNELRAFMVNQAVEIGNYNQVDRWTNYTVLSWHYADEDARNDLKAKGIA